MIVRFNDLSTNHFIQIKITNFYLLRNSTYRKFSSNKISNYIFHSLNLLLISSYTCNNTILATIKIKDNSETSSPNTKRKTAANSMTTANTNSILMYFNITNKIGKPAGSMKKRKDCRAKISYIIRFSKATTLARDFLTPNSKLLFNDWVSLE